MMVTAIISFIVILGVLVVVHELGHFIVAKLFKVKVDEFGLGFPPRAVGWKRKETIYSLNWIPVGGFVKIQGVAGGEQPTASETSPDLSRSFVSKPRWQRLLILVAGIVMNWVLSAVLLSVSYLVGSEVILSDLPVGAMVSDRAITVADIEPTAPALSDGLLINDAIISLDGKSVTTVSEVRDYLGTKQVDDPVAITVRRDGSAQTINTRLIEITVAATGNIKASTTTNTAPGIGAYFVETGTMRLPFIQAVRQGTLQTGQYFVGIFAAIGQTLADLVRRQPLAGEISGPLGVASLTYRATKLGWSHVIQFAAILSVNLAVFNLLPIPALDGGRLAFLLVEWVRRRPVDQKVEIIIHNIGYLALLFLILLVTINDVRKFF